MTGDTLTVLLLLCFVAVGWFYIGYSDRKKAMVAMLQMYQHHNCPVLVTSLYPGDTSVNQRADEWKTMLETSGNKWYLSGKLVVYTMPYNAYMKDGSLYGFTWPEYLLKCSQVQHQLILDFQEENKGVDPLLVTNYRVNNALN